MLIIENRFWKDSIKKNIKSFAYWSISMYRLWHFYPRAIDYEDESLFDNILKKRMFLPPLNFNISRALLKDLFSNLDINELLFYDIVSSKKENFIWSHWHRTTDFLFANGKTMEKEEKYIPQASSLTSFPIPKCTQKFIM